VRPLSISSRAELAALAKIDDRERPAKWKLSPWAVVTYLMGDTLKDGTVITPKYVGSQRLMEIAVATLVTDRALLLLGVPGTAKSWVSEHLAAAISGDSTLMVQGTAGTPEEAIRYGWNYALLLAKGPSREALVPSPVMRGMTEGKLVRVEELTRVPSDVQDTLITILSEKTLPVPELNEEIRAVKGFNIIATANDRDRGVNELSSALRRRFNTVMLPVPDSMDEEVDIVERRVGADGPLAGPAEREASDGRDHPRRHRLPRAPRGKVGRRQEQAQAALQQHSARPRRSA
jgi:MoxR-like ATPase